MKMWQLRSSFSSVIYTLHKGLYQRYKHIGCGVFGIFPPAAEYQVTRIAKANDMTEDEVREIIEKCTSGKFLGVFGEETVNVLKVNLMLDGIL